MSSTPGRVRLALVLYALALACGAVPARAQDSEHPAHSRSHKKKKRRRSTAQAASAEPQGPKQPGWDETEQEEDEAGGDEVGSTPGTDADGFSSSSSDSGDIVIHDPELDDRAGTMSDDRGWGGMVPETQASHSTSSPDYDPQNNTGLAHLELIGQQGIDIHHEGDLEDAYESRLRFDAEVNFRRSRTLRVSVGLRTDLLWALPARGDPALYDPGNPDANVPARHYTNFEQGRWELDILPLSAYVDKTFGHGFHLRIGEQAVSLRRMDFYSPIDMLAAFDMRGQPKLDPTSGRLSQPAIRVDWDLASWATLEVVYVPWFMPNLARSNRDRYVATVLGTRSPTALGATSSRTIDDLISPSYQTKVSETALRFVGPAPDFTHPQAQTRLTMRGGKYELAVSGGTALEKIPSVYVTPTAEAALRGQGTGQGNAASAFQAQQPLVDFEYHRYAQIGLDGGWELDPISLGWEVAYSPSRHLVAATKHGEHLPQPNVSQQIIDSGDGVVSNVRDKSIRKGVPLLQAAFHMDWINGEKFAIAAEAFLVKAMKLPYDLSRDWWGFVPGKGIYAGGLIGGTYTPNPDTGRIRFDMSLVTLIGPSYVVMPQVEVKIVEGFYANCGAQIFEGPKPQLGGAQNVSLGGLFSGYDQFLLGFRYLP